MSENINQSSGKIRKPARVWALFRKLPNGSGFFLKGKQYRKVGLFRAERVGYTYRVFVNPFSRVQTARFVNSKLNALVESVGRGPVVLSTTLRHASGCTDCGEPVTQPNSDNGISGPTS